MPQAARYKGRQTRGGVTCLPPFQGWFVCAGDPGAACAASRRTCPSLPSSRTFGARTATCERQLARDVSSKRSFGARTANCTGRVVQTQLRCANGNLHGTCRPNGPSVRGRQPARDVSSKRNFGEGRAQSTGRVV